MTKSSLQSLVEAGQSPWLDNIDRQLLKDGRLARMIADGDITGVTSNPTIFNNAISGSRMYDETIQPMAMAGSDPESIFYQLAIEDISKAADLFRPIYDQTNGADGYVSLEVSPKLARSTRKTVEEAKRLWELLNRPNVMIKIPATVQGLPAITSVIAAGINVNVTLIFSIERYEAVVDAYMKGLEKRVKAGLPIDSIASVASFFVSRIDTKVDLRLKSKVGSGDPIAKLASELSGKAAISTCKVVYKKFEFFFESDRFLKLASKGARIQRTLWASTSMKNPANRDVLYVEELIAPNTINTMPPGTVIAFKDHGNIGPGVKAGVAEAQKVLDSLSKAGIDMVEVSAELEDEGVKSFVSSYRDLLRTIDKRSKEFQKSLGVLAEPVRMSIHDLESQQFSKRLEEKDADLWTTDPEGQKEIRNRLGWVSAPKKGADIVTEILPMLKACKDEGITKLLLLGMGGSSLGVETISIILSAKVTGLELKVLDMTNPDHVLAIARWAPARRTLYAVVSKSGTTSESNAFMDYFWAKAQTPLGKKAGKHFIAITDPGTSLEKVAQERGFRKVFVGNPEIGGRYSALSIYGLAPAVLMGLDMEKFLSSANEQGEFCSSRTSAARNPGIALGAFIGIGALKGKDKVTLISDPELAAFGPWVEQLIAESSGKIGKGIVPIDMEPKADKYSEDRIFVYLRLSGKHDRRIAKIRKAGHPVMVTPWTSVYDLGGEFYRWEMATAVACSLIGVNPFDQPDVQESKVRTHKLTDAYLKDGKLATGQPIWENEFAAIYGEKLPGIKTNIIIGDVISEFLKQAKPGDYIGINAYLPRTDRVFADLSKFRSSLITKTGLSTTLGFGPRFQHSTGQLHKGGANNGIFIELTAQSANDAEIPGWKMPFSILETAQALGDFDTLLSRKRRVIRIHFKKPFIKEFLPDLR
jgi:transaldolase/glucose-6-phosphate isomerase